MNRLAECPGSSAALDENSGEPQSESGGGTSQGDSGSGDMDPSVERVSSRWRALIFPLLWVRESAAASQVGSSTACRLQPPAAAAAAAACRLPLAHDLPPAHAKTHATMKGIGKAFARGQSRSPLACSALPGAARRPPPRPLVITRLLGPPLLKPQTLQGASLCAARRLQSMAAIKSEACRARAAPPRRPRGLPLRAERTPSRRRSQQRAPNQVKVRRTH